MRFLTPLVVVLALILFPFFNTSAQVGIGTTTPSPHAVLELKSPGNNQGFLVPRLTTAERTAMNSLTVSDEGMLVFDSDDNKFYYWSGTVWIVIEDSVGTGTVTNIATGAGLTGGPITVNGIISLADNGVTTIKINNDAVTSAKILDGTVGTADLGNNAVTSAKLQSDATVDGNRAVTTNHIQDNAVTATKISNGAVTAAKLANTTVVAGTYGTGTQVSQITVDAQGRITSAANVTVTGAAPTGAAGGNLTGAYPNPTIATGAGTNIVTAVNDGATTGTINTNRLNTAVVVDSESPAAGDVSGSYTGGLQINSNAVTTAEIADGTVTSSDITDATIATVDLANSSVTDAKIGTGITVSKLSASATVGHVLTTVGTTTTWAALPDASATNEIQDLSLTTNTLSLSGDATTVNLAPYLDNTDAQALTFTSPNLSISGGNSVNLSAINTDAQILSFTSPNLSISGGNSINLSTINTDNQDLSLAGNTLSLTNDGTTVSLAGYLDNTDAQNLSLGTRTGTQQPVNISGGTSVTIDVADNDNSITNEIQDLSLTTNTLSLSGDATTVNLAPYLDNTDNQDLSLAGNTLSLTNDGTTVSLAGYLDNTDAQNLSLGTRTGTQQPVNISGGTSVTIDVADNDNSTTNEIQNLSLGTRTGTQQPVNISGGTGVTIDVADNDNSATNEIQNLSSTAVGTQRTISISGGTGTTIDVGDNDNSSTNELQDIASVLTQGNDAKTLAAVNFSAISINTMATPGALNVDGSHFRSFTVLPSGSDTYDVKPSDYIIIGRSTVAKPYNVILPKASDNRGRILIIRATGTGASDGIQVVSTESIDGSGALPIMFIEGTNNVYSVTVMSDGKDWYTISKSRY